MKDQGSTPKLKNIAQILHTKEGARKKAKGNRFHTDYWKQRIEKSANAYSVQIYFKGRRVRFPLITGEKDAAAERALVIFRDIEGKGWDQALAIHKPELEKKSEAPTVGELLSLSRELSSVRTETFSAYGKALRKIAADIAGIDTSQKERFDAKQGGRDRWIAEVDAVKLKQIDGAALLAWKNRYLSDHGENAKTRASAAVTVNSFLRNAQSVFSKKLRPFLAERIDIPASLLEAFETVPREKEGSLRYRSKIDADKILSAAEEELAAPQRDGETVAESKRRREAYKAILLCLVFGLRRSEADMLAWSQFDLDAGVLTIEDTEYKQLKSADSAGEIDLPAKLIPILQGFLAGATGDFVLESANPATRKGGSYRAELTFSHLIKWLRGKGIKERKPIHTLRKEIGAMIASEQGIFAASRYLRHSDIRITARLYADKKTPVVAPLAMFAEENFSGIEDGQFKKEEQA